MFLPIDIRRCGMRANETTLHPSHIYKSKPLYFSHTEQHAINMIKGHTNY